MSAIEAAATKKGGMPDRADVLAALKGAKFQGVAYAAPEAFDAKGDNIAAVIFVNEVDGDRFREIDQIGGTLDRGYSVLSAPLRFVMQEGVDVGFGDIGVSGEIGLGREKWPGISAFPASMNQVVQRGVQSRGANVRVRFEVVR